MSTKALHVFLAFFGIVGGVAILFTLLWLNAAHSPYNPFTIEGRARNALIGFGIAAVMGLWLFLINWFW